MNRLDSHGVTRANLVRRICHQLETAEAAIDAGRGGDVSPIAEKASHVVVFRKPSGKGVLPQGGSMFIRSFRLFSVRISVSFDFRVSKPKHDRYQICYLAYVDSDKPIARYQDSSSNSLRALLKVLPEVAKSICEDEGEDCWVGIVDNDHNGEIVAQVSTDLHQEAVVVDRHATVSEIVFLK